LSAIGEAERHCACAGGRRRGAGETGAIVTAGVEVDVDISATNPSSAGRFTEAAPVRQSLHPDASQSIREASVDDSGVRRGEDSVELTHVASYAGRLSDHPIRQELVDRIRAEITQGVYDTPEKLDVALDKLLGEIL
jgi:anti-sigma28 factor (negative regulator of flagellin synthesis)